MSTTIDQKVVEMRFDNKQFESNVAQTMSTLDKFKQKLNLTGASKGLEDISTSANKINMNGLINAVESVRVKFSALDVFALNVFSRISNAAITTGTQLVKSLSIDQITAGMTKYEQKTAWRIGFSNIKECTFRCRKCGKTLKVNIVLGKVGCE